MGGAEVATFRDELDLCDPIPVHTAHFFFRHSCLSCPSTCLSVFETSSHTFIMQPLQ